MCLWLGSGSVVGVDGEWVGGLNQDLEEWDCVLSM